MKLVELLSMSHAIPFPQAIRSLWRGQRGLQGQRQRWWRWRRGRASPTHHGGRGTAPSQVASEGEPDAVAFLSDIQNVSSRSTTS